MNETKICKKCNIIKPLSEFSKNRSECKSCIREYNKEYQKKNKEAILQQRKLYRETHKEELSRMYHEYYLNNTDKRKAYVKEYNKKNKEKVLAKHKEYREIHKEQIKDYYESHKEYFKEYKKSPRYKEQQKEYMKNNREHYKELNEKWKKENYKYYLNRRKKSDKKYRDNHIEERKEWINKNREQINSTKRKYESEKRKNDPLYKFIGQIRGVVYSSFIRKGYKKNSHTYEILGCDYNTFINHLLATYKKNYGVEWDGKEEIHIDHIIPISTAKNEEEVIALCYYENLQLLKAKDNLIKHDKLEFEIQRKD